MMLLHSMFGTMFIKLLDNIFKIYFSVNKNQISKEQYVILYISNELMIMLAKSALYNISVTITFRLYCGYRVIKFTTREQRKKEADSSMKRV